MPAHNYLPSHCRSGQCQHGPGQCVYYRSPRCVSGECTHGAQGLACGTTRPTPPPSPGSIDYGPYGGRIR